MQAGWERMVLPKWLLASPSRRDKASWRASEAEPSDTTKWSMARDRWLVRSMDTCHNNTKYTAVVLLTRGQFFC